MFVQMAVLLQIENKLLNFYDMLRVGLEDKLQIIHKLLVIKENKYPNDIAVIALKMLMIYSKKAGCTDVLHLHGFLKNFRCEKM